MKRELILEGLDCAHCASKIETKVKNISGIKTANLDFITKKLSFEVINNNEINNIIEQIKKIIKDLEPDVIIVEEPSNAPNSNKLDLIKLITGGGIYAIAFVFSSNFYLQLSLFIISYLIVGHEVILKALKNIKKGQIFDENFLMFIATIGAFAIKEFPEGVAVMLFYQVGELFQDMAVNHSRKSISALMDIRPDFANLKTPDGIKKVNPQQIKIGDIIIIKPGEKVPLDGKILDGNGMVDTSALTGESIPKNLKSGDEILSGFINKNALLTVEVTKAFGESTVSKILDLVQNASSKKATTENFITKFARYYTPAVVIIAFTLAVLPPLLLNADFSQWLYRALVFLVISCPCALVISIPLSFFGGIGGASKKGILVKGGNYLEALNDAEIIIFDKTGTLTKGVFNVTTIENKNGFSKEELLKYAAHAESYSNHPIATSIVKHYNNPINKNHIKDYNEISGNGIKANVIGKQVLVGNLKLMKKENIHFVNVDTFATVVHVAIDNVYAGYIIIADEIKPDSKIAVRHLKKIGIKNIAMLTGDNKTVATEIAKELEVDTVYSELLPYEKVEKLELLDKQKSQKGKLIFVGDGINDAPVLARADIGIAMGGLGSDAAIEAADIVLMTDEPKKIVTAIKIAKKTRKIVLQNIILALGIKLVVLILGAGGIATMWEAVFADVGVAIIAILNAMRVMNVKNI